MATAWESVVQWEKTHGDTFDAIVFSRPDILYITSMGPWCSYNLTTTWYAPWGANTPDMLWLFPRHTAEKVLTTWSNVILPCNPSRSAASGEVAWCCNLSMSTLDGPGSGADADRITYSNWLREYWARAKGFVPEYHSLRGWGVVSANPLKRWRNCTLHIGCLPGQTAVRRVLEPPG